MVQIMVDIYVYIYSFSFDNTYFQLNCVCVHDFGLVDYYFSVIK